MKNLIILFFAFAFISSCASDAAEKAENVNQELKAESADTPKKINEAPAKELAPPAGDYTGVWDYKVMGTPDGDYSGEMTIEKSDDGFKGLMVSQGNELKLEDMTISGTKMNCKFNFQGMYPKISGEFSKDYFAGKVSVQGMDFDMNATKKK